MCDALGGVSVVSQARHIGKVVLTVPDGPGDRC